MNVRILNPPGTRTPIDGTRTQHTNTVPAISSGRYQMIYVIS